MHVLGNGLRTFCESLKGGFQLLDMATSGASKSVRKGIPDLLSSARSRDEWNKSRFQGTNKSAKEEFVLANPCEVSRVGFGDRFLGDGGRRRRVGAIQIFEETIPDEGSLYLKLPREKICGGKLEGIGERNNDEWVFGIDVVRNGMRGRHDKLLGCLEKKDDEGQTCSDTI